MATYAKYLYNLKKLKDNPSVDNGIFICPSLIGVPKNDYKNNGDVYMANRNVLYGVGMFVRDDVKNKEESLITLNDLVDNLPEESNKVDIYMRPMTSPNLSHADECFLERCVIKHNDIPVKSCNITCVKISNSVYNYDVAWGYNYENHKVSKGGLTTGNDNSGDIYVKTSITKNNDNDEYTLFTSINQTPWSYTGLSKSYIYITVYFTVNKGDGDETELNTKQIELSHYVAVSARAEYVRYDGRVKFTYKFDETNKIYAGNNIEILS